MIGHDFGGCGRRLGVESGVTVQVKGDRGLPDSTGHAGTCGLAGPRGGEGDSQVPDVAEPAECVTAVSQGPREKLVSGRGSNEFSCGLGCLEVSVGHPGGDCFPVGSWIAGSGAARRPSRLRVSL